MDAVMDQLAEEPSCLALAQCCKGLRETKQSWALQDQGYMIWAPEEAELPRTGAAVASAATAVADDEHPANSSRTLVWWDMESSPPPTTGCSNPWDEIALHLVQMLALPNSGFATCVAYGACEVPERLLQALHKRGIVVHRRNLPTSTLPGAGTTLGMKSMIVDILFWALNNPPPAEVRIISATNEPNFQKLVRGLHRRAYNVHLASSLSYLGDQCCGSPSRFTSYWNSFWQQVPESEQSLSLAQLQLLHNCLCYGTEPLGVEMGVGVGVGMGVGMECTSVPSPRPTYRDVTSGGELISHGSSSPLRDGISKSGIPQASMADVRRWLESFVELEDSLLGMNISLVGKSFEKQGMKLDLKHLGCQTLSRLLMEHFSDLVRLKYTSKDCTVMFPAKLGAQALQKLMVDFTSLLTELLPKRDSASAMSLVKTAFKSRFGYELEHEAAGYCKLNQFLSSMPKLVRVRQCSSHSKELVICRPPGYYPKKRT